MDTTDLEHTYRRFFPLIRAKCARMLRDPAEAEDLAQETFTRLWAARASLRDDERVLGWVYQTATRLAVDGIRHRGVASSFADEAQEASMSSESESPSSRADARRVLERLSTELGERELGALVLSRIDGLTQGEIGGVLGISDRTVRRLLDRADDAARKARGTQ